MIPAVFACVLLGAALGEYPVNRALEKVGTSVGAARRGDDNDFNTRYVRMFNYFHLPLSITTCDRTSCRLIGAADYFHSDATVCFEKTFGSQSEPNEIQSVSALDLFFSLVYGVHGATKVTL